MRDIERHATCLHLTGWLLAVGLIVLSFPAGASADETCHEPKPVTPTDLALRKPVTLQTGVTADPINLGGLRGTAMDDITVTASPALPKNFNPKQITLDVPKRFARSGATISTSYLNWPTFTTPRILEHGKLIAFTMCLDATDIEAGSYIGQVIVGGPEGIQSTTVTVTLNAKNNYLFLAGIVLAGLIAFLLLSARSIKVRYDAEGKDTHEKFDKSLQATLKDVMGFWLPSLFAIGAAVIAMVTVYDSSPAWGADSATSLIALGGTAISAAGVGTFLSTLKGS